MKNFVKLYRTLDETSKTSEKINLLIDYFKSSNPEDSIWALSLLTGRKPKKLIPIRKLKEWVLELANIPEWLFKESYNSVGDLTETITLLLPKAAYSTNQSLHHWIQERLLPLKNKDEKEIKELMISAWNEMSNDQRFVWNKLATGSFKGVVSSRAVIKALSVFSGTSEPVISRRIMGNWEPTKNSFNKITYYNPYDEETCKIYPFCFPQDNDIEDLGCVNEWYAEWKWDGIRCQLIRRKHEVLIWSQGEELLNEKFPKLENLGFLFPDGTVIDGEIVPWKDGKPMPFDELQKRIKIKNLTKKILVETPVVFVAYDLIEYNGEDIRKEALATRKKWLQNLVNKIPDKRIMMSPQVEAKSWDDLKEKKKESRSRYVNGLILKRIDSAYCAGRSGGSWRKWKIEPLTADVILIYAQRGQGIKADLYTQYTFGVWDRNELVSIAKVNSSLNDEEILMIDYFIRNNTVEKFGPVRTVKPELVFELAFDDLRKSSRHKSGIEIRYPRINRWIKDKNIKDTDNLEMIKSLINNC